jgi:uncharacterized protein (TIGR02678 family)
MSVSNCSSSDEHRSKENNHVNEHATASDIFGDLPHVDAAQARLCARVLLRRPLVRSGGPDGELLPIMYRRRHVLQRLFAVYLGYQLRVERRFARLHKTLDAGTGRGISEFSPRSYVYLTLTLAALVEAGRQLLLSQLVSDIRGAAAEAGISVSDERIEMRALSLALRHLVDLGVLEETEGTVTSVAHESSAEALITVDMELLGLMAARLKFVDPRSQDVTSRLVTTVAQDVGILSHRRLVEDPVLLYSDLPADEAKYLRARQREESYWLDRYFGLQAEIRSEGIAVIDPDGYLTDLPFPAGSTVARMALLALEPLMAISARIAQDRFLVTERQIRDVCADLCDRYPKAWAKAERSNVDALASRVTDMLLQTGLACRIGDRQVTLSSAADRWQPQVEDKRATTEPSVGLDDELRLLDIEDGEY